MKEKKQFRHHPDGWIYINDLEVPLEDFVKEEPKYNLPKGWIGREYMQGEFHRLYDERNEKFLEKEWKEGDEYIKDYKKYKKILEDKKKAVLKNDKVKSKI